jgi:hypothetical protein
MSKFEISVTINNENNNTIDYKLSFNIDSVDHITLLLYLLRMTLTPVVRDPKYNVTLNIDQTALNKLKEYDKEINALLDNNPTAKMLMEQLKSGTLNPVALINSNNK